MRNGTNFFFDIGSRKTKHSFILMELMEIFGLQQKRSEKTKTTPFIRVQTTSDQVFANEIIKSVYYYMTLNRITPI